MGSVLNIFSSLKFDGLKKSMKYNKSVAALITRDSPYGNGLELLLLERDRACEKFHPGTWCLPGGKVEDGETFFEAVKREVEEEIGLSVENAYLRSKIMTNDKKVLIYYYDVILAKETTPIYLDEEHSNYQWMNESQWRECNLILDLKKHLTMMLLYRDENDIPVIYDSESTSVEKSNAYEHLQDAVDVSDAIKSIESDYIDAIENLGNQLEKAPDHVKPHVAKRIVKAEKNHYSDLNFLVNRYENLTENIDLDIIEEDLLKAIDTSQLIPKKVQIKTKDGKTYEAIRYVKSDEDVSPRNNKLSNIIQAETMSKKAKIKALLDMGIYDNKQLVALSQATTGAVYNVMRDQGVTRDVLTDLKNKIPENVEEEMENPVHIPAAKVDIEEEKVEFDEKSSASNISQTINALLEIDGIDFEDNETDKINPITGKDEVDSVQDNYTDMIAKKERKLAMFYGTGGVGKTYGVKQVLSNPNTIDGSTGKPFNNNLVEYDSSTADSDADYDYIKFTGKVTPTKVFRALYEHNDKIIMFDDADSVLLDEDSVNVLKAATDTTLEDIVWDGAKIKGSDGEMLPSRFKFTGGVIIISNLSEKKLKEKASPLLDSRALSLDVSRTMDETIDKLDRIKDLLPFEDRSGNTIQVSPVDRKAAIDFIKKYKNHMPVSQVNGRTLGALALLHRRGNYKTEEQWFKDLGARSLMNVKKSQIVTFHKRRLAEETRKRKEEDLLYKQIA